MFYTVSANFDMAQYSELTIKSFLNLKAANDFAKEQKEEFMNQIPNDGKLDEESSDHEHNGELFFFYGVSEDGENFITVCVTEEMFWDGLMTQAAK